jgi:uracil-DNA glycosylase
VNIGKKLHEAFRERAGDLTKLDRAAYQKHDKDPLEPIIGLGDSNARIGFFGRDPGKDEVKHGTPFIGAGGQKVRNVLYEQLYHRNLPDFDASMEVGKLFFWANTVPYKPIGNKAWPMKVKRGFHPLMAELLLKNWHGSDLIVLGREAFFWFGIDRPREEREALEAFWKRDDRYTASTEAELALEDGTARTFKLYPLPHPSPLNQKWYARFPELLTGRLEQLDARLDNLKI